MTTGHDTAARADAHPIPVVAPPDPLDRVGCPGPNGTGRWIAYSRRPVLDILEPNESAIVDLDRPVVDQGEGTFLVVYQCDDMFLTYVARAVDPLTKRGRLRRRVRAGGIRLDAADYGTRWWLYRVRQIVRRANIN